MSKRTDLGRTIWEASHNDEQSISVTGADIVADAVIAAGYQKPYVIHTAEELDALPDDSLVEASGAYLNGGGTFTECWIRPIPDHITGGTGQRLWEALIYMDGGVHNMTRSECITFPVTVLYEPAAGK